jgi:hypothetical protein
MWSSKIISLFFLVPFFILLGYIIYLLIYLTAANKSNKNSSLNYIWNLYFNPNKLIDEISAETLIGLNQPDFDPDDFINDAVSSQLDRDAHTYALNIFCSNNPDLVMDAKAQACVYATKEACEANSLKSQDVSQIVKGNGKFLTWQTEDSLGCVSSFGNGNACGNINCPSKVRPCTTEEYDSQLKLLEEDYNIYKVDHKLGNSYLFSDYVLSNPILCRDFVENSTRPIVGDVYFIEDYAQCLKQPYVPAVIKCEADGYCYPKIKGDYGKCIITEDYCNSKGVSYSSSGLGSCYETDLQSTTEALLGKTVTRSYRKAYQTMVNNCKFKSPTDITCTQARTTFALMPFKILVDSTVSEYTQVRDNILESCRINQFHASKLLPEDRPAPMSGPAVMQCVESIIEVWPAFFVMDNLNSIVNNLIRSIPGGEKFTGIDIFGIQSMLDFGGKVLDAIFKFGNDAGMAFQEGKIEMVAAYDNLLAGGRLVDFAKEEAAAFAHVAGPVLLDCAQLGLCVIKAGAKAMLSSYLYGAQAVAIIFNGISQGITALGTLLADKMNTCGGGSLDECFDRNFGKFLGSVFGAAAKVFAGTLTGFSWAAGFIATMFSGISDGIQNFFTCFFIFC